MASNDGDDERDALVEELKAQARSAWTYRNAKPG